MILLYATYRHISLEIYSTKALSLWLCMSVCMLGCLKLKKYRELKLQTFRYYLNTVVIPTFLKHHFVKVSFCWRGLSHVTLFIIMLCAVKIGCCIEANRDAVFSNRVSFFSIFWLANSRKRLNETNRTIHRS